VILGSRKLRVRELLRVDDAMAQSIDDGAGGEACFVDSSDDRQQQVLCSHQCCRARRAGGSSRLGEAEEESSREG
jgi:hypothetical protein